MRQNVGRPEPVEAFPIGRGARTVISVLLGQLLAHVPQERHDLGGSTLERKRAAGRKARPVYPKSETGFCADGREAPLVGEVSGRQGDGGLLALIQRARDVYLAGHV